jgi:hypothetical protein
MSVGNARWASGDGSAEFRRTGREGDLRSEAAKSAADPGGGQPPGRAGPFPGATRALHVDSFDAAGRDGQDGGTASGEVAGEPVGVGERKGAEGGLPALHGGALDESAGGGALGRREALLLGALAACGCREPCHDL